MSDTDTTTTEETATSESPWIETHADGTVGVTIKYGRGYEETWANFRGIVKVVRQTLIDYFGLSAEEVEGLSLHEIVVNVTKLAHAVAAASAGLGGTVISQGRSRTPQGGGFQAAMSEPAQPEKNPLYAVIEAAETFDAIKLVWGHNKAAIEADAELLAAWKAKAKSLKPAA